MRTILSLLIFGKFCLPASLPSNPNRHFSPNLDGSKDNLVIPLHIEDKSLRKWKVLIYTKEADQYRLIRSFESTNVWEVGKMTGKKFFRRMFQRNRPLQVPKSVVWDGYTQTPIASERGKYESEKVRDGLYYYRITAYDQADNTSSSPLVPIVVDTMRPRVELTLETFIFSPNGDNHKEDMPLIFQTDRFQTLDTLELTFVDREGKVVFKKDFRGIEGKKKIEFSWDGKGRGGEAPEGRYRLHYSAFDLAGNKKTYQPEIVELIRTMETATLAVGRESFSPDGNGYFDLLTLNPSVSSDKGLLSWTIGISDDKEEEIYAFRGRDSLPSLLSYDGRKKGGEILADGVYTAHLSLAFSSGNRPGAEPVTFRVDTAAPELSLAVLNPDRVFLPKAEHNHRLRVRQTAEGRGGETYFGFVTDENGEQVFTITYSDKPSEEFIWDGKNTSGDVVPGKYVYTLIGEDDIGNSAQVETDPFELVDELASFSLHPSASVFSPNADGKKDILNIDVQTQPDHIRRVKRQTLKVSSEKAVVYTAASSKHRRRYPWKGSDQRDKPLPNGKYLLQLETELTGGEKFTTPRRPVYIDTEPIEIDLKIDQSIFSPNQDGRQDHLSVRQKKSPSKIANENDRITLEIKNEKNLIFRRHTWKGKLPERIRWSGDDQAGGEAPAGKYTYELIAEDQAGNTSLFRSPPIELVRRMEKVDFELLPAFLSRKRPARLVPTFSSTEHLLAYKVIVEDEEGKEYDMALQKGSEAVMLSNTLFSGTELSDGLYEIYLETRYASGNQPRSDSQALIVDNRGPGIKIVTEPEYFSPDGDGIDDVLGINVFLEDISGIEKARCLIFRLREFDAENRPFAQTMKNYLDTEKPVQTWELDPEEPTRLQWNGRDEGGHLLVESGNDYQVFVQARDRVGNVSLGRKTVTVDILVEKIGDDRYRIIINNVHFKFASDRMIGQYQKTLNRLAYTLVKFPHHKIEVMGHTDTIGSDAYNLDLSLKRAKAVRRYLTRLGIQKERMTLSGRGEKELFITPEKDEEDRRRNRRVEFYLVRDAPR